MKRVSQKQLERIVDKWQKILRLEDWNVAIQFAESKVFAAGSVAHIKSKIHRKSALIEINKDTYANVGEDDLEDTIIHELLHLHFVFLDEPEIMKNDEVREIHLEQALEAIGPALYKLSVIQTAFKNIKPKEKVNG